MTWYDVAWYGIALYGIGSDRHGVGKEGGWNYHTTYPHEMNKLNVVTSHVQSKGIFFTFPALNRYLFKKLKFQYLYYPSIGLFSILFCLLDI